MTCGREWRADVWSVNHGTISGTTDVAGKIGRARHFNGIGDRITASAISVPAADFTATAWFRWTTNPSPYYSGIDGGGLDRKSVVKGKSGDLGGRRIIKK